MSDSPLSKAVMFDSVVLAMFANASFVRKAWCDVTSTFGKVSSRAQHIVLQDLVRQIAEEHPCLFFVDVKPCPSDMAGFERADERTTVDQCSAASIDDHDSAFHAGQRVRIDQVVSRGRQWHVQRDNVRLSIDLSEVDVAYAKLCDQGGLWLHVVCENAASKPVENVRRGPAYSTRTDQTDGLTMKVEPHETVQ